MNSHYSIVKVIGVSEGTEGEAVWGYALYNLDTDTLLSSLHKTPEHAKDYCEGVHNWGTVIETVKT